MQERSIIFLIGIQYLLEVFFLLKYFLYVSELKSCREKKHIKLVDFFFLSYFFCILVLQPTLEGNFCPFLMSTISGRSEFLSSTVNALRFASDLKCVCNSVRQNQDILPCRENEYVKYLRSNDMVILPAIAENTDLVSEFALEESLIRLIENSKIKFVELQRRKYYEKAVTRNSGAKNKSDMNGSDCVENEFANNFDDSNTSLMTKTFPQYSVDDSFGDNSGSIPSAADIALLDIVSTSENGAFTNNSAIDISDCHTDSQLSLQLPSCSFLSAYDMFAAKYLGVFDDLNSASAGSQAAENARLDMLRALGLHISVASYKDNASSKRRDSTDQQHMRDQSDTFVYTGNAEVLPYFNATQKEESILDCEAGADPYGFLTASTKEIIDIHQTRKGFLFTHCSLRILTLIYIISIIFSLLIDSIVVKFDDIFVGAL